MAADKVRDINIAPNNEFFYVNEVINCTASGNPEPTFRWMPIHTNGPAQINGPRLTVRPNMMGRNEWECQATNEVLAAETITQIFTFEVGELACH